MLCQVARCDPVDQVYGMLRQAQGTDDLLDGIRGTDA